MEIKIGKSASKCAACEHQFEHDEEVQSLVRLENQVLHREDYCRTCWEPEKARGAFSVWTPRYIDPEVARQEPPEVFSPLRQAFYESVEAETRPELAKAYLAAQLLRRQKIFRRIKESTDSSMDERVILFSDRINNGLIEVRDPNLTYDEMQQGRQSLMARLAELEGDGDRDSETEQGEDDNPDSAAVTAVDNDPGMDSR